MSDTFDLQELEGLYTSQSIILEATSRPTVPKGDYEVTVMKVTPRLMDSDGDSVQRRGASLQLKAIDPYTNKPVTVFTEVSWEPYRRLVIGGEGRSISMSDPNYDSSLPLDKAAKLWAQIEKVINPDGSMSIVEVLKALQGSQIGAYILEGFISAEGDLVWPDIRENDYPNKQAYLAAYQRKREAMLADGRTGKNYVNNFHALRGI
jgi:hypothetical protein